MEKILRRKNICRIAGAGLAVGVASLLFGVAPSTAGADTGPQSATSSAQGDGVLAGNSLALNVAAPIDVRCNLNGVGIFSLGIGFSSCEDGSSEPATGTQQSSSSASGDGVLTGNSLA